MAGDRWTWGSDGTTHRNEASIEDVFWTVAPCRVVEVYRRFRSACCLHHEDLSLIMEAAGASCSPP